MPSGPQVEEDRDGERVGREEAEAGWDAERRGAEAQHAHVVAAEVARAEAEAERDALRGERRAHEEELDALKTVRPRWSNCAGQTALVKPWWSHHGCRALTRAGRRRRRGRQALASADVRVEKLEARLAASEAHSPSAGRVQTAPPAAAGGRAGQDSEVAALQRELACAEAARAAAEAVAVAAKAEAEAARGGAAQGGAGAGAGAGGRAGARHAGRSVGSQTSCECAEVIPPPPTVPHTRLPTVLRAGRAP